MRRPRSFSGADGEQASEAMTRARAPGAPLDSAAELAAALAAHGAEPVIPAAPLAVVAEILNHLYRQHGSGGQIVSHPQVTP